MFFLLCAGYGNHPNTYLNFERCAKMLSSELINKFICNSYLTYILGSQMLCLNIKSVG